MLGYPGAIDVWPNHMTFVLARNRGGAWGLLQSTSEDVRRPFFLLVSAAAIAFIMTLYRRLQPMQRALKWGLPLVLGGALGNVYDRIRYGEVIDFIDVHMHWGGQVHHWPTFNVADIAICIGVGLMAIDMFSSKRPKGPTTPVPAIETVPADASAMDDAATDTAGEARAEGELASSAAAEGPDAPDATDPAPSPASDASDDHEQSPPASVAGEPNAARASSTAEGA